MVVSEGVVPSSSTRCLRKGAGALRSPPAELGIVERDRNGKRDEIYSVLAGVDMNINIAACQPRWAANVFILVSKPGFSFHLISKTGFKYV